MLAIDLLHVRMNDGCDHLGGFAHPTKIRTDFEGQIDFQQKSTFLTRNDRYMRNDAVVEADPFFDCRLALDRRESAAKSSVEVALCTQRRDASNEKRKASKVEKVHFHALPPKATGRCGLHRRESSPLKVPRV